MSPTRTSALLGKNGRSTRDTSPVPMATVRRPLRWISTGVAWLGSLISMASELIVSTRVTWVFEQARGEAA